MNRLAEIVFVLLLCFICCLIVSCGVDKEEYQRVKNYNVALHSKLDDLKKENLDIKKVLETATQKVEAAGKDFKICSEEMREKDKYIGLLEKKISRDLQQINLEQSHNLLLRADKLYVYHEQGLNLYETVERREKLAELKFGTELVRVEGVENTEKIVYHDGVLGKMLKVSVNGTQGYVFDGYLSRIRPKGSDESVKNWLNVFLSEGKDVSDKSTDDGCNERQIVNYKDNQSFRLCSTDAQDIFEMSLKGISLREGWLIMVMLLKLQNPEIKQPIRFIDISSHLENGSYGLTKWLFEIKTESMKQIAELTRKSDTLDFRLIIVK